MLEIGDFFGINTDLGIDPNSIPYPEYMNSMHLLVHNSVGD